MRPPAHQTSNRTVADLRRPSSPSRQNGFLPDAPVPCCAALRFGSTHPRRNLALASQLLHNRYLSTSHHPPDTPAAIAVRWHVPRGTECGRLLVCPKSAPASASRSPATTSASPSAAACGRRPSSGRGASRAHCLVVLLGAALATSKTVPTAPRKLTPILNRPPTFARFHGHQHAELRRIGTGSTPAPPTPWETPTPRRPKRSPCGERLLPCRPRGILPPGADRAGPARPPVRTGPLPSRHDRELAVPSSIGATHAL